MPYRLILRSGCGWSANGIIRNDSGFITVHSRKGEGTTFTIYLPLFKEMPQKVQQIESKITTGSETILLVDDEDIIIEVGQAILESLGYKALVAKGGKQAIERLRDYGDTINLVILDMIMPDMDGGKTFDQIRRLFPEKPVILSSGYTLDGQASEIMQRGCNGFIQKPFNRSELSEKIRGVLDHRKN